VFRKVRRWPLSWARWKHFTSSYHIFLSFILILSCLPVRIKTGGLRRSWSKSEGNCRFESLSGHWYLIAFLSPSVILVIFHNPFDCGYVVGYTDKTIWKLNPRTFALYFSLALPQKLLNHFYNTFGLYSRKTINLNLWFHIFLLSLNTKNIHDVHMLFDIVHHSRIWALLAKPPIVQLLKNFPAFYGTQRFITVFTRALH
jgi:hypothetical protein